MKIGSGIVIGKDDAAGASAVRKPPEDRRQHQNIEANMETWRNPSVITLEHVSCMIRQTMPSRSLGSSAILSDRCLAFNVAKVLM